MFPVQKNEECNDYSVTTTIKTTTAYKKEKKKKKKKKEQPKNLGVTDIPLG